VSFSNGFAGAIGYFTDSTLSRTGMATMVSVSSTIAIVCYWIMVGVHKRYLDDASSSARMAKYEV
jgi:hypothetical protein